MEVIENRRHLDTAEFIRYAVDGGATGLADGLAWEKNQRVQARPTRARLYWLARIS